jgi:hypothetical protein
MDGKVHGDDPENAPKLAVKHSILDSTFPVLLPYDDALFLDQDTFAILVQKLVANREVSPLKRSAEEEAGDEPAKKTALETHESHVRSERSLAQDSKALTANSDVTHISAKHPLVDLFHDLGGRISPDRLKTLLENAWAEDPLMTLKIIFNARSIHLGKSDRISTYRAFGWLAETHPHTLLTNLVWLVRPVIKKRFSRDDHSKKAMEEDNEAGSDDLVQRFLRGGINIESEDSDIINADVVKSEQSEMTKPSAEITYDVAHGVSHGYYKDLLNILVFAANDELKFDKNPDRLLTQKPIRPKGWRRKVEWDTAKAKELRRVWKKQQHERVVEKLQNEPFYRALHMTVARIFAQQLKEDKQLLESGGESLSKISLVAKWAPTFGEFHDKHTFILSTIAEAVYPEPSEVSPDANDREMYLRRAREALRKHYTSPLRKVLAIVEKDIAANTFSNINYDRVPSLAMDRYTSLFLKKDQEHFSEYVKRVAGGKAKISRDTLLPSTLVAKARRLPHYTESVAMEAQHKISCEIVNGQWETLVQRVKDSGTLGSSIAVCDLGDSMYFSSSKDGTEPIDSIIGLSLLVSEVTAPPFRGGFITFSNRPSYVSYAKDNATFVEYVDYVQYSAWHSKANFVAVFELILSMAVAKKLKQRDMVRQVFVFAGKQFDSAERNANYWTKSYERIKEKYQSFGYEMPKLVFWNLAAGRISKPVTMEDQNTVLVSGYSQYMLKVFLNRGNFEDEINVAGTEVEDGRVDVTEQPKADQLSFVKWAVSHKAYAMLKVVD